MKGRIKRDNDNLVQAKRQLIEIAKKVITSGEKVKAQIEMLREKPSRVNKLGEQIQGWLECTERVLEQTEVVLEGRLSIPRRLVSIFDTGARPIRRGKAHAETEFGRKVLMARQTMALSQLTKSSRITLPMSVCSRPG